MIEPTASQLPTPELLAEARRLADAATEGPWEAYDSNEGMWPPRPGWSVANEAFHNPPADEDAQWLAVDVHVGSKADADLIAASRTLLPELADRLAALTAENERLTAPIPEMCDACQADMEAPMCDDCYARSLSRLREQAARAEALTTVVEQIEAGEHATTGRQFGQGMACAAKLLR